MSNRNAVYKSQVDMKKVLFVFLLFPLTTSCTINITLAHTQGYANDLVDETASTDPEVETEIPLMGK